MSETREARQKQLTFLFDRQNGRCHICGEPAVLDGQGGRGGHGLSAVRFRTGSSFGAKGRVRRRVMAHRKCADERSNQIVDSQPIDEIRARARAWPTVTYSVVDQSR